MLLGCN